MPNLKEPFTQFIHSTNVEGSNKASSYILALNWLNKMIEIKPFGFKDCMNVWEINSIERAHDLYLFVLEETRKKDASAWNIREIPKSYLQNGYCSAALKSYQAFLVEYNYEKELLDTFEAYDGNEDELPNKLEVELNNSDYLIEGLDDLQGIEVIRSVRVRSNQNIFRKMILKIYCQSCCITGLNIPEINRASHIIPWAEDDTKRLDPRNGLCLSATYDAAFDKNLISLDEDYRIIVSKNITDYYANESVKEYFKNKVGLRITLPSAYLPHPDYLEQHRCSGYFE